MGTLFIHKLLHVALLIETPINPVIKMSFVLQVCMETQRFERLMEYFKNEDNNIDFMVCSSTLTHTHAQTNKHTCS